jgi:two-component system chemotaxis response regulator CheB
MGRDGADGLQDIAQAGGSTLVQDQESCVVFGMPQRAIELGAAQHVLPVEKIPLKLKQLCAGQFR